MQYSDYYKQDAPGLLRMTTLLGNKPPTFSILSQGLDDGSSADTQLSFLGESAPHELSVGDANSPLGNPNALNSAQRWDKESKKLQNTIPDDAGDMGFNDKPVFNGYRPPIEFKGTLNNSWMGGKDFSKPQGFSNDWMGNSKQAQVGHMQDAQGNQIIDESTFAGRRAVAAQSGFNGNDYLQRYGRINATPQSEQNQYVF